VHDAIDPMYGGTYPEWRLRPPFRESGRPAIALRSLVGWLSGIADLLNRKRPSRERGPRRSIMRYGRASGRGAR
jgi:hypothetical protein